MAAVHFTTIPSEPNTANNRDTQRKPHFYYVCPCTKDVVQLRLENFITFLFIFKNVAKVYVR